MGAATEVPLHSLQTRVKALPILTAHLPLKYDDVGDIHGGRQREWEEGAKCRYGQDALHTYIVREDRHRVYSDLEVENRVSHEAVFYFDGFYPTTYF